MGLLNLKNTLDEGKLTCNFNQDKEVRRSQAIYCRTCIYSTFAIIYILKNQISVGGKDAAY